MLMFNNDVMTRPSHRSGVHWPLTDPVLIILLVNLVGLPLAGGVLLPPGRALLPELDAGRPQVHHELRHPPHRHPGDDRLRQLEARVLEPRQTELQAGLVPFRSNI